MMSPELLVRGSIHLIKMHDRAESAETRWEPHAKAKDESLSISELADARDLESCG